MKKNIIKNYKKFKNRFKSILLFSIFITSNIFAYTSREKQILIQITQPIQNNIDSLNKDITQIDVTSLSTQLQQRQKAHQEISKVIEKCEKEINKKTNKITKKSHLTGWDNKRLKLEKKIKTLSNKLEQLNLEKTSIELEYQKIVLKLNVTTQKINLCNMQKQQLESTTKAIQMLEHADKEKDLPILSKNSFKELPIYTNLFPNINYTVTHFGQIQLALDLDIKRKTKQELNDNQTRIHLLLTNKKLFTQLHKTLEQLNQLIQNLFLVSTKENIESLLQISDTPTKKLPYNKLMATFMAYQTFVGSMLNSFISSGLSSVMNTDQNIFGEKLPFMQRLNNKLYESFCACFSKNNLVKVPIAFGSEKIGSKIIPKLPTTLLQMGGSIGINLLITKTLGIPYLAFMLAKAPINAGISFIKNISEQKKNFTQNIKQQIINHFINLRNIFTKLEEIQNLFANHEIFKPLTLGIEKLFNHINRNDRFGALLRTILRSKNNFENYKNNPEQLKQLCDMFINVFVDMKDPIATKLIANTFKDIGNIDKTLSLTKLCTQPGWTLVKYNHESPKPYIHLEVKNKENEEIEKIIIDGYNYYGLNKEILEKQHFIAMTYILAQLGIVRADKAIISPIDNLFICLNTNENVEEKLKNLETMLTQLNILNPQEKTVILINNQKLQEIDPQTNFGQYSVYSSLINQLNDILLPKMHNGLFILS